MFAPVAGNTLIKVASRDQESEIYYVSNKDKENYHFDPKQYQPDQLNLF